MTQYMKVDSADNLRIYRDPEASVVVLEYEVHGEICADRTAIQQSLRLHHHREGIGKVTHWRDYLDPVAVFDALGWPESG